MSKCLWIITCFSAVSVEIIFCHTKNIYCSIFVQTAKKTGNRRKRVPWLMSLVCNCKYSIIYWYTSDIYLYVSYRSPRGPTRLWVRRLTQTVNIEHIVDILSFIDALTSLRMYGAYQSRRYSPVTSKQHHVFVWLCKALWYYTITQLITVLIYEYPNYAGAMYI